MKDNSFLGELGLILLLIVLGVIVGPILVGIGVAIILGLTGISYYGTIIIITLLLWFIIWYSLYKD